MVYSSRYRGRGRRGRRGGKRSSKYRSRGGLGINRSYTVPKNFVEQIKYATVVSTPGTDPASGNAVDLSFKPNIIPNLNGVLSSMYRQFCIRGVKLIYQPAYSQYALQTGVAIMPKIYFAEDKTAFETDVGSGNVDRIMTQDNVRVFKPNQKWSHYVKFPKPFLLQETAVAGEQIAAQLPMNRPMWLSLKNFTPESDVTGLEVEHNIGRLVSDSNNGLVNITLGTLYYKIYYSVKEQTQSSILS